MSNGWKEAVQLLALGIGVTLLGLVVGAFLMSPGVSRQQRLMAFAALGGAAALVLLLDGARRLLGTLRSRRSRRSTLAAARHGNVPRSPSAAPTIALRSGRGGRTPKAVQALAAAGAAPTEIAWKTGLPLDAVSMLLELGGRR